MSNRIDEIPAIFSNWEPGAELNLAHAYNAGLSENPIP